MFLKQAGKPGAVDRRGSLLLPASRGAAALLPVSFAAALR